MIRWLMIRLSSFFHYLANLCDPHVREMRRTPTEAEIKAQREREQTGKEWWENKKKEWAKIDRDRIKSLLAADELSQKESEELAALVSKYEGSVIFLDDPVVTEKERL